MGTLALPDSKKKHITIDGNTITLNYKGKSGVIHEKSFSDALVAKELSNIIAESPSKFIFTTPKGLRISSEMVNRYLKEYGITAKDIRGYNANKYILSRLKGIPIDEDYKKRKKEFNKSLKLAAAKVGHGAATLKKHYLIPELGREYIYSGNLISLNNFYSQGGEMKADQPMPESVPAVTNAPINKTASAASRFRPYETILFEPAIVGPSGAKLTAYTWLYEWQEDWNANKGELEAKRVSDWSQAVENSETGRNIVHQFVVEMPDGKPETVSAESVLSLLGYTTPIESKKINGLVSAVKTLAQQRMKMAVMQVQQKEYTDLLHKLQNEDKPPITQKERLFEGDPHGAVTVYAMGDADVWQRDESKYDPDTQKREYINSGNITDERKQALTEGWISNRLREAGVKQQNVYDLSKRIQRQEKKVEDLTKSKIKVFGADPQNPRKMAAGGAFSLNNYNLIPKLYVPGFIVSDFVMSGNWRDFEKAKSFAKHYLDLNIENEIDSGEGSKGIAYRLDNGHVLKFTISDSEAEFSNELVGKKSPYQANIYAVHQLNDNRVYVIEREYLEPLSKEDEDLLDELLYIDKVMYNTNSDFDTVLKKVSENDRLSESVTNRIRELNLHLTTIHEYFKQQGLQANDIYGRNLGLKNGVIACFDCKYHLGGDLNPDIIISNEMEPTTETRPIDLGPDHKPFLRVADGGSSCLNCRFIVKTNDGQYHCTNEQFIKYEGTSKLPNDPENWCSDWYKPNPYMIHDPHNKNLVKKIDSMAKGGPLKGQDNDEDNGGDPNKTYIPKAVRAFMPGMQQSIVRNSGEFKGIVESLNNIIKTMPSIGQTEEVSLEEKIAYLRYFYADSVWYILEKDSEADQLQAFGYAILNGDFMYSELGYINVEELKDSNKVELDFHFIPKKLVVALAEEGHPEYLEYLDANPSIETPEESIPAGSNPIKMSDEVILQKYPTPTKFQAAKIAEDVQRVFARMVDQGNVPVLDQDDRLTLELYEGIGGSKSEKDKGIFHQFYTPYIVGKKMWELAYHFGLSREAAINVLEPSMGTGRLFKFAPYWAKLYGFDTDKLNVKISNLLYPSAEIFEQEFETAFLEKPYFTKAAKKSWLPEMDLVIGNPPYGDYRGYYSSYMPKSFKRFEFLFVYLGLKLLRKGGLLIFVVSQNFMNNGGLYAKMKEEILALGEFVDAYRLPNSIFASTEVGTDIVVFRKK